MSQFDTPEALQGRRRLAQALMGQGVDSSPVGHWTQAAARVAQALSGRLNMDYADTNEREGKAAGNQALLKALGGGDYSAAMSNPHSSDQALQMQIADRNRAASAANQERLMQMKLQAQQADPMYQAKLKLAQAQAAAAQQKANPGAGGAMDARIAQLQASGIDPESAEGRTFRLTGKLPAAAYGQIAQNQRKITQAPQIGSGLQNLNQMAEDYDDSSFSNAVGPFQGSTPDGLFSALPINIARGFGEVANAYQGGKASPTEVRNNIVGATETLAAAIKPLIRAPGEGVWTDQDQARLVAIVGDLSQSRDKGEFRRRLNAVRDRIRSNFNIDIPFDAFGNAQQNGQKFMGQPLPTGPTGAAQGAASAATGGWSIKRVK